MNENQRQKLLVAYGYLQAVQQFVTDDSSNPLELEPLVLKPLREVLGIQEPGVSE